MWYIVVRTSKPLFSFPHLIPIPLRSSLHPSVDVLDGDRPISAGPPIHQPGSQPTRQSATDHSQIDRNGVKMRPSKSRTRDCHVCPVCSSVYCPTYNHSQGRVQDVRSGNRVRYSHDIVPRPLGSPFLDKARASCWARTRPSIGASA
jgi:hypothetical protein